MRTVDRRPKDFINVVEHQYILPVFMKRSSSFISPIPKRVSKVITDRIWTDLSKTFVILSPTESAPAFLLQNPSVAYVEHKGIKRISGTEGRPSSILRIHLIFRTIHLR